MFKNYIKITLRQLWKHKLFSALNIFGLAASMSVCLLLIMILADQYGYDNFHEKGDRIYRVISADAENRMPNRPSFATTSRAVATDLEADYPFVEKSVRALQIGSTVAIGEKKFEEGVGAFMVDQSFLEVFDFSWTAGDKNTALLEPRTVVLTEKTAKRFFPYSDPIGAQILVNDLGTFTVTGILPEPPIRSHIRFDYLMSYASVEVFTAEEREAAQVHDEYNKIWRGMVYLLLDEDNNQQKLDQALASIAADYGTRDGTKQFLFQSQALADVMPSQDLSNEVGPGTPKVVVYFLLSLGLIIIFCACFNYTNLSVARSLKRAKEIGLRKVVGAKRKDIIFQFLGEAIVIAVIALLIAVVLLELLIPAFYGLDPFVGQTIYLKRTPQLYLVFLIFSVLIGLLAGALPAFNISRLKPIESIQKLANIKVFSRLGLQKVLIVFQFALSLVFILAVNIILQQQQHVLNSDFGIRIDDILNVRMNNDVDYDLFAQKVEQIVGVEGVSASSVVLLTGENAGVVGKFKDGRDSMNLLYNSVTPNYLSSMDIELVAGKNLPENINSQGEQFVLLNEMAVERMGFETPEAALGQSITIDSLSLSIVGVTTDFHQDNIWFEPVKPFALRQNINTRRTANVRLQSESKETVAAIQEVWKEFSPDEAMIAFYTSGRVNQLSKFFRIGSKMIGFVGFLTILIACLGLLGIVVYTVEGRVKEVGIRKVLGASSGNIVWQLSKSFIILLAIAIVIAIPLTIFGANMWLQNFIMRISVSPAILLTGIGIILGLGLLTVGSQTYWAARNNPVESLRNE